MGLLVGAHLADDGSGTSVLDRNLLHVQVQMPFHLPLGFCNESQAAPVTRKAGDNADGEGARVPQGVQQAGAVIQFTQPLLAPGQMVRFLAGSLFQQGAGARVAGHQCLPVIKALGRDFAGVVHPYQARCAAPLDGIVDGIGGTRGRAAGPGGRQERPQSAVHRRK